MTTSFVFKILAFSIILNFSTGVIMALVPEFKYHDNIDTQSEMMGLKYNETFADDFTGGMNETLGIHQTIKPQQTITDSSSGFFQLLNKIGLGFIATIINLINQYLYGFVSLLSTLFGGYLSSSLNLMIFGGLYTLMTFVYVFAAWSLWTGKEVF